MTSLKEDVAVLKEQVRDIKENHLVHLQTGIDRIESRLDKGQWFLISTLLGVVITLAMLWFK